MKQNSLVLTGKRQLKWMTNDLPALEEDEVLVRTIAGAISIGAELPQYIESDLTVNLPSYPKQTGYENYGEVVRIGEEVKTLKIGDRVVASYGHRDLGIVKEQKAIPVPKDIHYSYALLTILSCDAAKGVLKLNPRETDKVLVTGMGTMGLLTVYFLKQYMKVEHVDVLEPHAPRGSLAKIFGATDAFNRESECPKDTYPFGFECSAYNGAFETLQRSVVKGGGICVLSDGNKERFQLSSAFYEKELKIIGSSDGWDYAKHAEWFFREVDHTPYVNKIFELQITKDKLIECFQSLSRGQVNPLKVLVTY